MVVVTQQDGMVESVGVVHTQLGVEDLTGSTWTATRVDAGFLKRWGREYIPRASAGYTADRIASSKC